MVTAQKIRLLKACVESHRTSGTSGGNGDRAAANDVSASFLITDKGTTIMQSGLRLIWFLTPTPTILELTEGMFGGSPEMLRSDAGVISSYLGRCVETDLDNLYQ